MQYYLGIDGGGTKTEMLLVDREGNIAAHATGVGTNPNRCSEEELRRIVADNIASLLRDRREPGADGRGIATIFAGVAGASHPRNTERMQAAYRQALPCAGSISIASDTVPALWSGTLGEPGIVLIAGTGATAYGEDHSGRRHRAGGWGYLVGDDGSGYALGREAVRAVCRFFDGSGDRTVLWDDIARAHNLAEPIDLIPVIYGGDTPFFERLVPLVLDAFRRDDSCAVQAMEHTVASQAVLIQAVYRTLDFQGRQFILVLKGGLMGKDGEIRSLLLERLRAELPEGAYRVDDSAAPPVFGAALLALAEERRIAGQTAGHLHTAMAKAGLL